MNVYCMNYHICTNYVLLQFCNCAHKAPLAFSHLTRWVGASSATTQPYLRSLEGLLLTICILSRVSILFAAPFKFLFGILVLANVPVKPTGQIARWVSPNARWMMVFVPAFDLAQVWPDGFLLSFLLLVCLLLVGLHLVCLPLVANFSFASISVASILVASILVASILVASILVANGLHLVCLLLQPTSLPPRWH